MLLNRTGGASTTAYRERGKQSVMMSDNKSIYLSAEENVIRKFYFYTS